MIEETIEDVNEVFEALLDDTPDIEGVRETVNVAEEFNRLTLEGNTVENPVEDLIDTALNEPIFPNEEDNDDSLLLDTVSPAPIDINAVQESMEAFNTALDEAVEELENTTAVRPSSVFTERQHIRVVEAEADDNESSETHQNAEEFVIPVNSRTTLIEDSTARFSGASWFEKIKKQQIAIIGQGGIGSWTSLIVSRLGINRLTTYDGDKVESVNMAGQMFGKNDVGSYKSSTVHNRVCTLCEWFPYNAYNTNFRESSTLHKITIGALDNMEWRKKLFACWKRTYPNLSDALFIDGRLSADELQIFIIPANSPERIKDYEEKWLFEDSEGEHTLCSFKQTTYMATMIASLIGNVIVNFCANLADPDAMFDFPYYINYNAEMMYFKTQNI